jgi:hypothetical protein
LVFNAVVPESIRVVPFLLVLSWLFSTFIGFLINCGADFCWLMGTPQSFYGAGNGIETCSWRPTLLAACSW